VTDEDLLAPLAPDCAALRETLIGRRLPPVWQLEAEAARQLSRDGNLAVRAAWQPPVDGLAVTVTDLPAIGILPPMRRYVSDDTEPAVTMVWLHGGGWVLGDLDTADAICRTLCDLTGWEVVSIAYRCAPDQVFPAAVDDALAATDWILAERDQVVVGGDSAGGTLAAVVAQQRGAHPRLVGQLLVYPCTDPQLRSPSAHAFVDGPFLTRRDMEWFYAQYLAPADLADPRADLTRTTDAGAHAPAVVLTVGHDPLRDEGIAYARALEADGGTVVWIHAPELFHGAFAQAGVLPSAAIRVREVCVTVRAMFT
jgi:acetyl esterase